jgi:hypothetical protein
VVAGVMLVAALPADGQVRERRIVPVDAGKRQTFEKQVKVALLVGVGDYSPSSGLGALKYPAAMSPRWPKNSNVKVIWSAG